MSNKNAKQYTATMENALACIGGAKGLSIPDTFTVAYKDKTGASHLKTLIDELKEEHGQSCWPW